VSPMPWRLGCRANGWRPPRTSWSGPTGEAFASITPIPASTLRERGESALRRRRFDQPGKPNAHDATERPHRTSGILCAAWSSDGQRVAYVSQGGGPRGQPGTAVGATAINGTMWVAKMSSLTRPKAVAQGVFPECPARPRTAPGRTSA
jgi:hypothetical protein